jgi:hypothetical protein
LVEEVRRIKQGWSVKIQPSREAEILYRLVAQHRGPFPKQELCAIWRLLIVATLSFEGPFSVAVYAPSEITGCWDLARDHFGGFVPMTRHGSCRSVIESVHRRDATLGVLPLPSHDDPDPWWRLLVTQHPDAPRIIARLPFICVGNARAEALGALAVCPVSVVATGRDRSFVAIEINYRMSSDTLTRALRDAGLEPKFVAAWREDQTPNAWLYLIEVEGFLLVDDGRIDRIRQTIGHPVSQIILLGGYAAPLTPEELAPAEAAKADATSPGAAAR